MHPRRISKYVFGAMVALTPLAAPAQAAQEPTLVPSPTSTTAIAVPRQDQPVTVRRGSQSAQVYPIKTIRTASGAEVAADRVIVALKPTIAAQAWTDVHQQASARGAGLASMVASTGAAQIVDTSGAASVEEAVRAYQADSRVRYAEPDYIMHKLEAPGDVHLQTTTPNDPLFSLQWGMTKINAPLGWDTTRGSASVKVAVLDCGIYDVTSSTFPGHPDINGKVTGRVDFTGSPFGSDDFCDHGTHVAGIVAASTNNGVGVVGVGWNTSLLNVKVLDDNGSASSTWVASGLHWAADNGAKVVNMSLGSASPTCPAILQGAVDYAWNHGVVVVAAAGNGDSAGNGQAFAATPANCSHALAVAATDPADAKASFSNFGANVHVAAPGVNILSTNFVGEYESLSGTSQATPHVSGLAALLWATPFGTSNEAVVARIKSTADPIPGTGILWTSGRINVAAAVSSSPTVPTPTPPPSAGLIQTLASPQRMADSRTSGGAIGTGLSRCFQVAGLNGIPSDAAAVVLNVTAAGYATQGWLSVFPSGQSVPATSTVNFDTSEYAVANGAIMRLGSDGQVCVNVGTINSAPGSSQVILDATGFLSASALAQLSMLPSPQRVADTRSSGGAIQTGQSRCFTVAGVAGVPADAAAVVLNVTAAGYATRGWLSVYPNGQSVPATSTVNFDTSEYAIANGTIMRVGSGGQVCVNVGTINSAPGSSQAILDVTGYLTSTGLTSLVMLPSPQRVADTRSSGGSPIQAGQSRCFTVAGVAGIPANATAVIVNLTAAGYSTQGWLTAYSSGQAVPATSTLNFDPSEYAMANGTILPIGTAGQVCVSVGTINNVPGSSHSVLDVVGYLTP